MQERQQLSQRPISENAWHGDFAVPQTGDISRLHTISGVDAEDWRICGVDVSFSYGEPTGAGVFAVERHRLDAAGGDWARLAEEHDDVVPVTEFALPAIRAIAILELFPDISLVAARAPAVMGEGVQLKVVERVLPVPI